MRFRIAVVTAVVLLGAVLGYYYYAKSQPRTKEGRPVIPGLVHAGDAEFDRYRRNVLILDNPKGEVWTNFKGDRVATISGKIMNEGEKVLEAVELKITLYDSTGKVLKEDTRTPIRPGLGLEGRPLRSLETRVFSVMLEGISIYWDPQRVDVDISGLKFAK
jgi:hypothetical protein